MKHSTFLETSLTYKFMSSIYQLLPTDLISQTFDDINDNFTNLNTDKADKVVWLQQFASTTSAQLDWVISDSIWEWSLLFWNALDFYKYSIVTSVASGNLTVALKNFEGNDPTATKPVKIQIGGVIRTITSACYINATIAWTNWWNTWSAELATKEIDWFVYILDYNNSGAAFNLWISRYPLYNNLSEATWWYTSEKYLIQTWNIWIENVVNIGRFNATLSAGAWYTWSIGTSLILNQPTLQTRYLDYVPVGVWYTAWWARYRIDWNSMNIIIDSTANITGNITVPFTCTNTVDNQMTTNAWTAVLLKNTTTITVATNPQKITWFYWI